MPEKSAPKAAFGCAPECKAPFYALGPSHAVFCPNFRSSQSPPFPNSAKGAIFNMEHGWSIGREPGTDWEPDGWVVIQSPSGGVRLRLATVASAIAFLTPQGDTLDTFEAAKRFLATGDSRVPQVPARLNPDRGEPLPDPFEARS